MNKDVKILIVGAIGIGFFAWALTYADKFNTLVTSTTQGYGNVVKALEPGNMGSNVGATTTLPGYSPGMPS